MYKKLWFCSALLCTGLSYAQQTESNTIESLEEVVLIDSKFDLKREHSGKVVSKITAKELENALGQTIPDVINRVSGIEINGSRSNEGQNLGYYVRGGRNREVVILVDGVQLSDPSSISNDFDLRLLSLDQVASIEIFKGASSTLYGSGAAAAVINITTKEPVDEKIGLQVRSTLGTNQTQQNQDFDIAQFDNAVGLSGEVSDFNYQVNFSHRYSENLSAVKSPDENVSYKEDPFSKQNLYARIGYTISDQLKFYFFGNFDKFNSSYDDAFMYADADNRLKSEQFRTGSHWEATYTNGSFIFSDSYTELNRAIVSEYPNKYDSKVYAFDTYNKYVLYDKFHTVIGVNGVFSSFNSYSIPFGETEFAQTVDEEVADFDIVDPYINVVYISDFGFNLNTGTRLNIHSQYGSNFVYNINPSYNFDLIQGRMKLLASYSTAYITPSLYQLYDSNYGNRELRPEGSRTMEAGFEFQHDKITFSGVYFNRNSENFIDFVTVDAENFISEYQNISEDFTSEGMELEIRVAVMDNLDFSGNYTFTEAAERFALRIPKHKINAVLKYQIAENTFASLSYQFNDTRTDSFYNSDTFENELVNLESFGIADIHINHRINDNVKVFGGVSNFTNVKYEEIYRFNSKGRNASIGVALNF